MSFPVIVRSAARASASASGYIDVAGYIGDVRDLRVRGGLSPATARPANPTSAVAHKNAVFIVIVRLPSGGGIPAPHIGWKFAE